MSSFGIITRDTSVSDTRQTNQRTARLPRGNRMGAGRGKKGRALAALAHQRAAAQLSKGRGRRRVKRGTTLSRYTGERQP